MRPPWVRLDASYEHQEIDEPNAPESGAHRTWADVRRILADGDLDAAVRDRALDVFERLEDPIERIPGVARVERDDARSTLWMQQAIDDILRQTPRR